MVHKKIIRKGFDYLSEENCIISITIINIPQKSDTFYALHSSLNFNAITIYQKRMQIGNQGSSPKAL